MKHAAIIQLDYKMLLELMDFKDGIIHRVYTPDNLWEPNICNIVIEHPDLPEVEPNKELDVIMPIMEVQYNQFGVKTSVRRIYPPKKVLENKI